MSRYFKYLLFVIFIASVLVIVFLQFNSNRSINNLIYSNENLLSDLTTKSDIQHLLNEILTLESNVRGTVIRGSVADSENLYTDVKSITTSFKKLGHLNDDKSIQPLVQQLEALIDLKVVWSDRILDSLQIRGKSSAEALIVTQYGKRLTDSIKSIIIQIDAHRQLTLTKLILEADANGQKAKTLGTVMAIIAAIASIFAFLYVAFKVRQQQQLIGQLNKSERKAKDAVQIKEKFLANMSHEIRTPLNAILGFTGLLQRKNLDQDSQKFVQTIQKSGENLLTIINDVLDLSKIEAGMMRIESAPFSLYALVNSVETMFRQKSAEKNIDFHFSIAENIPDTLEGDANRLTQILVNLIGNSIKFTEEGNIVTNFRNRGITDSIINLEFSVADTGIGIEKHKLNQVFERFSQAEDSVTRRYGGTGLGLSIVNELVILQNGSIKAESQPGTGTVFTISLPYKIASVQAELPSGLKISRPEPDLSYARLLIVEDNEINQSLLKHLFEGWRIQFDIVNNGLEAIEILKQKTYSLILMDIQMPEMDGYTATYEIRHTLKLSTPIIAMTAHALEGEREKCIGLGMNEYIPKPIREQVLHSLVAGFLKTQNKSPALNDLRQPNPFTYIQLDYLREVSRGDSSYEKLVTEQFIEAIPGDLTELEHAWKENRLDVLRRLAHTMKSTVSIMGLTERLQPWLDQIEYKNLNAQQFSTAFNELKTVLNAAVTEAERFHESVSVYMPSKP